MKILCLILCNRLYLFSSLAYISLCFSHMIVYLVSRFNYIPQHGQAFLDSVNGICYLGP